MTCFKMVMKTSCISLFGIFRINHETILVWRPFKDSVHDSEVLAFLFLL